MPQFNHPYSLVMLRVASARYRSRFGNAILESASLAGSVRFMMLHALAEHLTRTDSNPRQTNHNRGAQ